MRHLLFFLVGFPLSAAHAIEPSRYLDLFSKRDACFVLSDTATGNILHEYQSERCAKRFPPCSTFKVAAALMAFEKGVLKDDRQVIKWDGVHRNRSELNRDQTPYSWMKNSAMWVTQWLTPQLGPESLAKFMSQFAYGNQNISGGITKAWVDSTLKVSADEQLEFMTRLWRERLQTSKRAVDLTKKIIFIKKLGKDSELYGKTGTGCLDPGCDEQPGRMLGWFVGVLKVGLKEYAFAANATDFEPMKAPAGSRVRDSVIKIIEELKLPPK